MEIGKIWHGGGRRFRLAVIVGQFMGHRLALETAPGLFSPRQADRGTLAMLSCGGFSRRA